METTLLERQMQYMVEVTGYEESQLQDLLDKGFTAEEIIRTVRHTRKDILEEKKKLGPNLNKKGNIEFVVSLLDNIEKSSTSKQVLQWTLEQKRYWRKVYDKL